MNKKDEIDIPLMGLTEWRKNNVPPEVWDNPYLQAYLKRVQLYDTASVIILTLAAIASGMKYMQYLMR